MGYYLLLYYDGKQGGDCPNWEAWDQEISNSLVEGGNAADDGLAVTMEKSTEITGEDVSGYRIIKATDFDEAIEISKGAPPLYQGGRAEIYPVQMPAMG